MFGHGSGDFGGERFPIYRQRRTGGNAMLVGGAHDQRAEVAHFLMEQADRVVFRIVGAKAVRTDHFRQPVAFVRRRHIAAAAHLAEANAKTRAGELPGSFGPGQTAADDVNIEIHEGLLVRRGGTI